MLGAMRVSGCVGLVAVMLGTAGCHSAYVEAVVRNGTAAPVSLVELDYPTASFGTQTLAPGGEYRYRFKVLGSGKVKLLWTDTKNVEQHADGPELQEGDEGSLAVTLAPAGVAWDAKVGRK